MKNTSPAPIQKPSKPSKTKDQSIYAERDGYNITLKYSDEAIEKKLIKFTAKSKKMTKEIDFVMSLSEIAEVIIQHLNAETLTLINADTKKVPMCKVNMAINGTCDRDFAVGDPISFMYPLELPVEIAFAFEALRLATIDDKVKEFPISYMLKAKASLLKQGMEYAKTAFSTVSKDIEELNKQEASVEGEKEEVATKPPESEISEN